ncbi:tetratricopeptide repeat-containing sensor histidine kinase [Flagellimonas olearia]|uniref:histidine kinase n=1 Tax=Flagellimonas olearia TaxID=552546 RepID=A0A444VJ80_9FLAO|nr:tetratricopeptide repeat-containing sensor histidine kinase [Allomuricauda olearia]RYC50828.1 hypothetical protein DN53_17085 [Allomuricauda olearia]
MCSSHGSLKLFLPILVFSWVTGCKQDLKNSTNSAVEVLFEKSKGENIDPKTRLEYLNTALGKISEKDFDSLALAILYNKSYGHYLLGQLDSSHYVDVQTLKRAIQLDNTFYIARAARDIGIYYDNKQVYDSAFFYHNVSKNHFLYVKDSNQVGRRLLRLGIIQKNKNDFFGAKETLVEALQFLGGEDAKYIASVQNELGTVNRKLSNHEDAINYFQKAIATTSSDDDKVAYKNNLATAYIDVKDYTSSMDILEKLLSDSEPSQNAVRYARILHNYTYAKWKNGSVDVEKGFSEALKIRKNHKDYRGQISSYTDIADFFLEKEPTMALRYLDTAITLSRKLQIPQGELDALSLQIKLNPQEIKYKSRYITLSDSIYGQELRVKTQFAKLKYDDHQEKEHIAQLEKDAIERRAYVAEQKNQKIILLSLSGMLLIGGISLFLVLKQKQKNKTLQEVYNTERRISKKIHDELANTIYGVMASVQYSPDLKKELLLDNLDVIYHKTRDISHETADVKTNNFNEELKKLISFFQTPEVTITIKGMKEDLWENITDSKKIAIHRALNELLVNMKKHSGSTLVVLDFERQQKVMRISYKDNGVGFQKGRKRGLGLENTENRIRGIGGTFIFDSEPEKGMKATILFHV